MFRRFVPLLLAALIMAPAHMDAADAAKKGKSPPAKSNADSKKAGKTDAPAHAIPDGAVLNILIRRTLLTLNDANMSNNYTVLRDLAAPGFQSANDAKKLSDIFSKLRASKMDFAPIVYFDPKLIRPAEITKAGLLRVSGFMPTRPQQVNFDMLFQNVSGRWLLFGIAVNTSLAKSADASPAGAGAKKGN